MKCRLFNVISLVSAAVLVCTTILWIATFFISPWDHRLSLTQHFHVSVWSGFSGDTLGCLVFFNDPKYGPYRGSIISLANESHPSVHRGWSVWHYSMGQITDFDEKGKVDLVEVGCDLPGVYFRHIRWANQDLPLWTLMISLWYPIFLFGIFPAIWIYRRMRFAHTKHVT